MSKNRRRRRQAPQPQPADSPSGALDAVDTFAILALHADARDRSADIVDLAKEAFSATTTAAVAQAKALVEAAEEQAALVHEQAEHRATELQERTRQASSAVAADAAAQAGATTEAAQCAATDIRTAAEADGKRLVEEATAQARTVADTAQERADKELAAARFQAEQLQRSARRDAGEASTRLRAADDEAKRIRQVATEAAAGLRRQAAADINADRERAVRDAEELSKAAAVTVASAEKRATEVSEQATNRETAAKETEEEAHRLLTEAQDAWERAHSRTARRQERKEMRQQGRQQRSTARREHKQAKGRPALAQRLGQARKWARELVRTQARRILVAGPILAPMAVAWWSQTDYAKEAFGWWTISALGFAAAWELTTAFTGWMYHQARQQGDAGTVYRIMTWVFAAGAAAMNYAHHCGPGGKPTQASVAFATMSIVGMVLWELYASLVHRQFLREQGLVSRARPKIGLIRWIRFPVRAWTAWSLTIENASLSTLERAWNAAGVALRDRNAVRSGLARHRMVIPRVPTAGLHRGAGPTAIPAFHTIWNAPYGTYGGAGEHRNGTERPQTPEPGTTQGGTERSEGLAPLGRHSAEQGFPGVPFRSAPRTAVPGGTGTERLPAGATPEARTAERDTTATELARNAPGGTPEHPERNGTHARNGRERTSGAERDEDEVVLDDKERAAVERLRAKKQPLSKRSVSEEVRSNGETIADDRALKIANYLNAKAKDEAAQHLAGV
ncbi:hypothetical protein ACIREO_23680 [Streptomyces sp. NPDC102441]|uniref:hypothetical protein n=1 Tax=Streptomyces sp. NPDC102441 TaxID=3366176 RepID=UPI00381996A6